MKIRTRALIVGATLAATLALPAIAHADNLGGFRSPSGNINCEMGVGDDGLGSVICQGGSGFKVKAPCEHSAWGDRFTMTQGSAPVSHCHNDTIVPSYGFPGPNPDVPILAYGQTKSAGTITCDSEVTGMTCTDTTTGHYVHVARHDNEIG
jgi:hypothetical protein